MSNVYGTLLQGQISNATDLYRRKPKLIIFINWILCCAACFMDECLCLKDVLLLNDVFSDASSQNGRYVCQAEHIKILSV